MDEEADRTAGEALDGGAGEAHLHLRYNGRKAALIPDYVISVSMDGAAVGQGTRAEGVDVRVATCPGPHRVSVVDLQKAFHFALEIPAPGEYEVTIGIGFTDSPNTPSATLTGLGVRSRVKAVVGSPASARGLAFPCVVKHDGALHAFEQLANPTVAGRAERPAEVAVVDRRLVLSARDTDANFHELWQVDCGELAGFVLHEPEAIDSLGKVCVRAIGTGCLLGVLTGIAGAAAAQNPLVAAFTFPVGLLIGLLSVLPRGLSNCVVKHRALAVMLKDGQQVQVFVRPVEVALVQDALRHAGLDVQDG